MKYFNLKKVVALVTSACFLFSFVFAQPILAAGDKRQDTAQFKKILERFTLPFGVGRITDARFCQSQKVVINIQDLHCHPEVQRNINRIISMIDDKYHLSKVYVEGAIGNVDTSWLNSISDVKMRDKLANALIDQGRLTGAEYYSIASGRTDLLYGLEDGKLYRENSLRLSKIISDRENIERLVSDIYERVNTLKSAYYTSENQKLEKLIVSKNSGETNSDEYYGKLGKFSTKIGLDFNMFENMSLYLDISRNSKELNFKKIAAQLQSFLGVLKQQLPYSAYSTLVAKTNNFSKPEDLYVYLSEIVKTYKLDLEVNYPELKEFLAYIDKNQTINPMGLINEERKLIRDLRVGMSKSYAEKEIAFLDNFSVVLKDYLENKLTAEDYVYYEENKAQFKDFWSKYIPADTTLNEISKYSGVLDEYYKVNVERNKAFLNNSKLSDFVNAAQYNPADEHIEKTICSLDTAKEVIVMVTGGFHTAGVAKLLKEKKVSYLIITPNVTQDSSGAEIVYNKLIDEQNKVFAQAPMIRSEGDGKNEGRLTKDEGSRIQIRNTDSLAALLASQRNPAELKNTAIGVLCEMLLANQMDVGEANEILIKLVNDKKNWNRFGIDPNKTEVTLKWEKGVNTTKEGRFALVLKDRNTKKEETREFVYEKNVKNEYVVNNDKSIKNRILESLKKVLDNKTLVDVLPKGTNADAIDGFNASELEKIIPHSIIPDSEEELQIIKKIFNSGMYDHLVYIDINQMREMNIVYGKRTVNKMINSMFTDIAEMARSLNGLACRVGGDEIVIAFPDDMDKNTLVNAVEKLSGKIERTNFVTVSLGNKKIGNDFLSVINKLGGQISVIGESHEETAISVLSFPLSSELSLEGLNEAEKRMVIKQDISRFIKKVNEDGRAIKLNESLNENDIEKSWLDKLGNIVKITNSIGVASGEEINTVKEKLKVSRYEAAMKIAGSGVDKSKKTARENLYSRSGDVEVNQGIDELHKKTEKGIDIFGFKKSGIYNIVLEGMRKLSKAGHGRLEEWQDGTYYFDKEHKFHDFIKYLHERHNERLKNSVLLSLDFFDFTDKTGVIESYKQNNTHRKDSRIDNGEFKVVNDAYDHNTGDQVLWYLRYLAVEFAKLNDYELIITRGPPAGPKCLFIPKKGVTPKIAPEEIGKQLSIYIDGIVNEFNGNSKIKIGKALVTYTYIDNPARDINEIFKDQDNSRKLYTEKALTGAIKAQFKCNGELADLVKKQAEETAERIYEFRNSTSQNESIDNTSDDITDNPTPLNYYPSASIFGDRLAANPLIIALETFVFQFGGTVGVPMLFGMLGWSPVLGQAIGATWATVGFVLAHVRYVKKFADEYTKEHKTSKGSYKYAFKKFLSNWRFWSVSLGLALPNMIARVLCLGLPLDVAMSIITYRAHLYYNLKITANKELESKGWWKASIPVGMDKGESAEYKKIWNILYPGMEEELSNVMKIAEAVAFFGKVKNGINYDANCLAGSIYDGKVNETITNKTDRLSYVINVLNSWDKLDRKELVKQFISKYEKDSKRDASEKNKNIKVLERLEKLTDDNGFKNELSEIKLNYVAVIKNAAGEGLEALKDFKGNLIDWYLKLQNVRLNEEKISSIAATALNNKDVMLKLLVQITDQYSKIGKGDESARIYQSILRNAEKKYLGINRELHNTIMNQKNVSQTATVPVISPASIFDPLFKNKENRLYKFYTNLGAPIWESVLFWAVPISLIGFGWMALAGTTVAFSAAHIFSKWIARAIAGNEKIFQKQDFADFGKYIVISSVFSLFYGFSTDQLFGLTLITLVHSIYNILATRFGLPVASITEQSKTIKKHKKLIDGEVVEEKTELRDSTKKITKTLDGSIIQTIAKRTKKEKIVGDTVITDETITIKTKKIDANDVASAIEQYNTIYENLLDEYDVRIEKLGAMDPKLADLTARLELLNELLPYVINLEAKFGKNKEVLEIAEKIKNNIKQRSSEKIEYEKLLAAKKLPSGQYSLEQAAQMVQNAASNNVITTETILQIGRYLKNLEARNQNAPEVLSKINLFRQYLVPRIMNQGVRLDSNFAKQFINSLVSGDDSTTTKWICGIDGTLYGGGAEHRYMAQQVDPSGKISYDAAGYYLVGKDPSGNKNLYLTNGSLGYSKGRWNSGAMALFKKPNVRMLLLLYGVNYIHYLNKPGEFTVYEAPKIYNSSYDLVEGKTQNEPSLLLGSVLSSDSNTYEIGNLTKTKGGIMPWLEKMFGKRGVSASDYATKYAPVAEGVVSILAGVGVVWLTAGLFDLSSIVFAAASIVGTAAVFRLLHFGATDENKEYASKISWFSGIIGTGSLAVSIFVPSLAVFAPIIGMVAFVSAFFGSHYYVNNFVVKGNGLQALFGSESQNFGFRFALSAVLIATAAVVGILGVVGVLPAGSESAVLAMGGIVAGRRITSSESKVEKIASILMDSDKRRTMIGDYKGLGSAITSRDFGAIARLVNNHKHNDEEHNFALKVGYLDVLLNALLSNEPAFRNSSNRISVKEYIGIKNGEEKEWFLGVVKSFIEQRMIQKNDLEAAFDEIISSLRQMSHPNDPIKRELLDKPELIEEIKSRLLGKVSSNRLNISNNKTVSDTVQSSTRVDVSGYGDGILDSKIRISDLLTGFNKLAKVEGYRTTIAGHLLENVRTDTDAGLEKILLLMKPIGGTSASIQELNKLAFSLLGYIFKSQKISEELSLTSGVKIRWFKSILLDFVSKGKGNWWESVKTDEFYDLATKFESEIFKTNEIADLYGIILANNPVIKYDEKSKEIAKKIALYLYIAPKMQSADTVLDPKTMSAISAYWSNKAGQNSNNLSQVTNGNGSKKLTQSEAIQLAFKLIIRRIEFVDKKNKEIRDDAQRREEAFQILRSRISLERKISEFKSSLMDPGEVATLEKLLDIIHPEKLGQNGVLKNGLRTMAAFVGISVLSSGLGASVEAQSVVGSKAGYVETIDISKQRLSTKKWTYIPAQLILKNKKILSIFLIAGAAVLGIFEAMGFVGLGSAASGVVAAGLHSTLLVFGYNKNSDGSDVSKRALSEIGKPAESLDEIVNTYQEKIDKQLSSVGVIDKDRQKAQDIMSLIKDLYSKMEKVDIKGEKTNLLTGFYHNMAHNLKVTFGALLITSSIASANPEKDYFSDVDYGQRNAKLTFMAAMLHDFHMRDLNYLDPVTGKPTQMSAVVDETMRQVRDMLFLAGISNVKLEEPLSAYYKNQISKQDKIILGTLIKDFLGEDDFINKFDEMEAAIRKTDYGPHRQSEIDTNYKAAAEKLENRKGVVNDIAENIQIADLSGFYWGTTKETVVDEVVPGLKGELGALIQLETNYMNFFKTALVKESTIMDKLAFLPEQYKENFIDVMDYSVNIMEKYGERLKPESVTDETTKQSIENLKNQISDTVQEWRNLDKPIVEKVFGLSPTLKTKIQDTKLYFDKINKVVVAVMMIFTFTFAPLSTAFGGVKNYIAQKSGFTISSPFENKLSIEKIPGTNIEIYEHVGLVEGGHNIALADWIKAFMEGKINPGADLVHIDSHEDFKNMVPSEVFEEFNKLIDEISKLHNPSEDVKRAYYERARSMAAKVRIDSFNALIMLSGIVGDYKWIIPDFYKKHEEKFNEKRAHGISNNGSFIIKSNGDVLKRIGFNKVTEYNYTRAKQSAISSLGIKNGFILSIDLDYFVLQQETFDNPSEKTLTRNIPQPAQISKTIENLKKQLAILKSKGIVPSVITISESPDYTPDERVGSILNEIKSVLRDVYSPTVKPVKKNILPVIIFAAGIAGLIAFGVANILSGGLATGGLTLASVGLVGVGSISLGNKGNSTEIEMQSLIGQNTFESYLRGIMGFKDTETESVLEQFKKLDSEEQDRILWLASVRHAPFNENAIVMAAVNDSNPEGDAYKKFINRHEPVKIKSVEEGLIWMKNIVDGVTKLVGKENPIRGLMDEAIEFVVSESLKRNKDKSKSDILRLIMKHELMFVAELMGGNESLIFSESAACILGHTAWNVMADKRTESMMQNYVHTEPVAVKLEPVSLVCGVTRKSRRYIRYTDEINKDSYVLYVDSEKLELFVNNVKKEEAENFKTQLSLWINAGFVHRSYITKPVMEFCGIKMPEISERGEQVQILEALEENIPIQLILSGSESIEDADNRLRVFSNTFSIFANEHNISQDFAEALRHVLVVEAFRYGNKSDISLPIYVRFDLETKKLYVYDHAKKDFIRDVSGNATGRHIDKMNLKYKKERNVSFNGELMTLTTISTKEDESVRENKKDVKTKDLTPLTSENFEEKLQKETIKKFTGLNGMGKYLLVMQREPKRELEGFVYTIRIPLQGWAGTAPKRKLNSLIEVAGKDIKLPQKPIVVKIAEKEGKEIFISGAQKGHFAAVILGFLENGRPVVLRSEKDQGVFEKVYEKAKFLSVINEGPEVYGWYEFNGRKWMVMDVVPGIFKDTEVEENGVLVKMKDYINSGTIVQLANTYSQLKVNNYAISGDFQYFITSEGDLKIIDQGGSIAKMDDKGEISDDDIFAVRKINGWENFVSELKYLAKSAKPEAVIEAIDIIKKDKKAILADENEKKEILSILENVAGTGVKDSGVAEDEYEKLKTVVVNAFTNSVKGMAYVLNGKAIKDMIKVGNRNEVLGNKAVVHIGDVDVEKLAQLSRELGNDNINVRTYDQAVFDRVEKLNNAEPISLDIVVDNQNVPVFLGRVGRAYIFFVDYSKLDKKFGSKAMMKVVECIFGNKIVQNSLKINSEMDVLSGIFGKDEFLSSLLDHPTIVAEYGGFKLNESDCEYSELFKETSFVSDIDPAMDAKNISKLVRDAIEYNVAESVSKPQMPAYLKVAAENLLHGLEIAKTANMDAMVNMLDVSKGVLQVNKETVAVLTKDMNIEEEMQKNKAELDKFIADTEFIKKEMERIAKERGLEVKFVSIDERSLRIDAFKQMVSLKILRKILNENSGIINAVTITDDMLKKRNVDGIRNVVKGLKGLKGITLDMTGVKTASKDDVRFFVSEVSKIVGRNTELRVTVDSVASESAEACTELKVQVIVVMDISEGIKKVDSGTFIEISARDGFEPGTEAQIRERVNELNKISPAGVVFPLWFFTADVEVGEKILANWKVIVDTNIKGMISDFKAGFTPKTPEQIRDYAFRTMFNLKKVPRYTSKLFLELNKIITEGDVKLAADLSKSLKDEFGAASMGLTKVIKSGDANRIRGAAEGLIQKMLYEEYCANAQKAYFTNPNDDVRFAGLLYTAKMFLSKLDNEKIEKMRVEDLKGMLFAAQILNDDKAVMITRRLLVLKESTESVESFIDSQSSIKDVVQKQEKYLSDNPNATMEEFKRASEPEINEAFFGIDEKMKQGSPISIAEMLRMLDVFADRRPGLDLKEDSKAILKTNFEAITDLKSAA